ncbi:hypothetical protein BHE74_00030621, partial [Ensete ventricosum]
KAAATTETSATSKATTTTTETSATSKAATTTTRPLPPPKPSPPPSPPPPPRPPPPKPPPPPSPLPPPSPPPPYPPPRPIPLPNLGKKPPPLVGHKTFAPPFSPTTSLPKALATTQLQQSSSASGALPSPRLPIVVSRGYYYELVASLGLGESAREAIYSSGLQLQVKPAMRASPLKREIALKATRRGWPAGEVMARIGIETAQVCVAHAHGANFEANRQMPPRRHRKGNLKIKMLSFCFISLLEKWVCGSHTLTSYVIHATGMGKNSHQLNANLIMIVSFSSEEKVV